MRNLKLFESHKIRSHWSEEEQKWYFSVVDVVAVLTEQDDFQKARKYWNKLKERLKKEGSEIHSLERRKLTGQGACFTPLAARIASQYRINAAMLDPRPGQ